MRTGRKRQVDIVIHQRVGQFELLIIIDCKNYNQPIDVKKVEEFMGLVEDVGANKGAMVSAKGFTSTAKRRARDGGIDLYRLIDAQNENWSSYVAAPVVCDFRSIHSWRCKFMSSNEALSWIVHQPPQFLPLYNYAGSFIGSVQSLLWGIWNKQRIPIEPATYTEIVPDDDDIYVQVNQTEFHKLKISYEVEVIKRLYFGYVPLTKIQGLSDEIKGGIVLPKEAELETSWIDSIEVEHSWRIIPSIDVLAVKPFFILEAYDRYPIEDPFRI